MDAALRGVLARKQSDEALRAALEELARRSIFRSFTWLWGPALNARDRVRFRPLMLSCFSSSSVTAAGKWVNPWQGENASALEVWLSDADRSDDVEMFRRLLDWKISDAHGSRQEVVWRAELVRRIQKAPTRAARHTELAKMDIWGGRLDEPTALLLYELDAEAAQPFILEHLPWNRPRERHPMWNTLRERALAKGDTSLASALYRRWVDEPTWRRDALTFARTLQSPAKLVATLKEHHPETPMPGAAQLFVELAEARGRDVVPYLLSHLRTVAPRWGSWGRKDAKGLPELLALARARDWDDVWGALLRTSAMAETYDAEVLRLAKDDEALPARTRRRLLQLAGVGGEWNLPGMGIAQMQPLTDATAIALYARFPELVRGPFRMHVASGSHAAYPELLTRALEANDEDLLDFLASRAAMHVPSQWSVKDWGKVLDALAAHYEALPKEGGVFARRAANALGALPAFSMPAFDALLEKNRLARLFFLRSDDFYLAEPRAVRELLEAPEIHVQALAFRLLGRDSAKAREVAAQNVDLLQATLLRPLHRRTRHAAFAALANAAAHDVNAARVLMPRVRDAFALPDSRYPKESLMELLARMLTRWPELRGPLEVPHVFGPPAKGDAA